MRTSIGSRVRLVAFTLLAASWTFMIYLAHYDNYDRCMLSDLVYYRAPRPFVYRTLLPSTVNVLARLVPGRINDGLKSFVRTNPFMQQIFTVEKDPYVASGRLKLEKNYPVETLIALALFAGCLAGYLYLVLQLYDLFYVGPSAFREIVPAAAALGLVAFAPAASHAYDASTTFLSCLSFYLIAKARWRWFLVVFFLACVNKETAILTTGIFILYFLVRRQWRTRLFLSLTAAQFAIFLATKFTISYLLRGNPGQLLEFHLFDTNAEIFARWIRVGFDPEFYLALCTFAAAIAYQWTRKPLILRCWFFLWVPIMLLSLLFGVFNEWRQYSEAFTPGFLIAVGSVASLFGVRPRELSHSNFNEYQ
jgi:hypothetical protein